MYTILFYSLIAVIFCSIFATLLHDEFISVFYFLIDILSGGRRFYSNRS